MHDLRCKLLCMTVVSGDLPPTLRDCLGLEPREKVTGAVGFVILREVVHTSGWMLISLTS